MCPGEFQTSTMGVDRGWKPMASQIEQAVEQWKNKWARSSGAATHRGHEEDSDGLAVKVCPCIEPVQVE